MSCQSQTVALAIILCLAGSCRQAPARSITSSNATPVATPAATPIPALPQPLPTTVVMHNVILHENDLKLRVRWLRGTLTATQKAVVPSFDEPASFALDIQEAAASISFADLAAALNASLLNGSALRDVKLSQAGNQLKLSGTLHKGVPLPIEVNSDIDAAPDGRVHIRMAKIHVLKLPVKTLMKVLDIKTADMLDPKGSKGIEAKGDDIFIDPEQVLPEPRKRGKLTAVHLESGSIAAFYGNSRTDIVKTREWRNFISIRGGTVGIGKLAMSNADIVMIDLSPGEWFDFNLTNYQRQLANGYIRMTPQAGLRVFMPDSSRIPANAANNAIHLQWMKNRNQPPPNDLVP